ncbi:ATP-binding protein [Roseovarius pacificus]|uniref:HD domain-containing protein n=1 Tax=Roseovarius pacificus TaxID=337701 RepID=UPI002A18C341|nr:ATP-binding protein [Roseovarius pacificus]
MNFKSTKLWLHAFEQRDGDQFETQRARLASQLLTMREKVEQLVSFIPVDCKDLTIHDITHLDALWEAAQQITGEKWELNPAEAFVFGAAVLIHDAGLTTLAYPKGKAALKASDKWQDLVAYHISTVQDEGKGPSKVELSAKDEADLLFTLLRELHAHQAESLCLQSWELEGKGSFYLIDDSELRAAFGETIGRIAASHHWDAERVHSELSSGKGGSPKLPAEWTINECKLGCLIRCADAAQVDRTRAPLTLYAALGPEGYARLHWEAQSKLNRPFLKDDAIHFTSSSSFLASEADAWWIAFDLASILEKELRASNAILTDIGEQTFAAQRVAGAEAPATFSRYVNTSKWRPIDATVRVTDPLRLARTLGGRNLYGASQVVPFRELIQNAADAIRARRALEGRGVDFGIINVSVEQHPSDDDMCVIHVDDNGIGMSERVLSTTLVDFGKSLWNSNLIRDEFPGLKAANVNNIGKFGIGFFSVFEIADKVQVVSKRYDAGVNEIRALDFRSLATRPILREANSEDLPRDISTRVTLSLPKATAQGLSPDGLLDEFIPQAYYRQRRFQDNKATLKQVIQGMCCFLDIELKFLDHRNGTTFSHTANIYEKNPDDFIAELPFLDHVSKGCRYFSAQKRLRPLTSENGDAFGRAALDIDCLLESRPQNPRGFISVGGIAASSSPRELRSKKGVHIPFFGVIEGKTERAARDISSTIAPDEVVNDWLVAQIKELDQDVLRTSEIMSIASFALTATDFEFDLPFAFHAGRVKSAPTIIEIVKPKTCVCVPVRWRYESWVEVVGYSSLRPEYFEASLSDDVLVLASGSERLLPDDKSKELKRTGGGRLELEDVLRSWQSSRALVEILNRSWSSTFTVTLKTKPVFSTRIASLSGERWVVEFEKVSA